MPATAPPIPDDAERLERLRELLVLDSAPEPLFDHLARLASEVCGVPIALMSLVDTERQWFKANVGLPGVNETPRDVAFCAHAIVGDRLFEVPDARADPRFRDNPLVTGEPDIRFYAGAPLVLPDGHRAGTLCVIDRQPRQLDAAQQAMLATLASIASQALLMRRDLTVRALAIRSEDERAIAASEARHRELVEQQSELVSLARPDGELVYVNPAYVREFGVPPGQLVGSNLFALADPADHAAIRARFARLLAGQGSQRGENRNLGAGGRLRWIAWVDSLQRDAQDRPLIHSVGRDVTAQRQAERALQASQAFLERTGRVAGVGGWQLDLDSGALDWTAQTRRIHEVAPDFVPTMESAIDFYAPDARGTVTAAVQAAVAQGRNWDLELPLTTAAGRPIWVRAVGEVEFEHGRAVRLVGAFQDITERRAMREQLVDAAEQIHDLYDNAPCGYYSVDAQGRFVQINAQALSWLGCSRDAVLHKLGPSDFFSEDGRNLLRQMFPVLKTEGRIGPLEFELCSRDGSRRWVSLSATAVTDAAGNFLRSRSVIHDVTEVHDARAETDRLTREQSAMLDNELVGIVKLRNRVAIWQNRAMSRMFGYEADELIGQPSRLLYIDDASYDELGRAAYAELARGGRYRRQLQMQRKDGTLIWVDASAVVLSPETGESMWLMTDITQMMEHQQRVEHTAFHDSLTGLPNRLLLADRMQQAMALNERRGQVMAVCYLDLDGFKAVNDRLGHDAGDRLLVEVAARLLRCVRNGDTVARLGGDEFVVLLTPLGLREEAAAVLDRILHALSEPAILPSGAQAQVSASIGVAMVPDDGRQPAALLATADAALYQAKRSGRNQVVFASAPPPSGGADGG